ncbi:hypothetical protein PT974_04120 [Cladobotryum mycophilum]|uniref:MYND-type domain-containing protein n=1 Tax=Cladobotryum mycophilum TaxID=491253 RepID=A0ABR0SUA1_9HYPO
MLTPTVANRFSWFYAAGNTPAVSLTRSIPHGQNADILSLGCGDLRNILYTSYVENGLSPRKLDITSCDIDEKIIGRNIILLTLIIDNFKDVTLESLWDIYYHMFVEDGTAEIVLQQVQKLKPFLKSPKAWKASPYGSVLSICDEDTLHDVQNVCRRVESAAEKRTGDEVLSSFSESLRFPKDYIGDTNLVLTGMRSAAPLSLQSQLELPTNFRHYWSEGTVIGTKLSSSVPNPMIVGLVSEHEILHYGTDPLLGYHLATAFAKLSENSPLKPELQTGEEKIAVAAKGQFFEWVGAFRTLVKKKQIVLRFVVSDVFALCHTFQLTSSNGAVSANWYRRQFDAKILHLDEDAYGAGAGAGAPTAFDVIETSNLSDHVGALNIAVSAGPLLKPRAWATVYTNQLVKRDSPDQQVLDNLLRGPSATVSLLLGLTSFQYWTNSKNESHVDEIYLTMMGGSTSSLETQFHSRLAWRRDDQLGVDATGRPKLHMEPMAVAKAVFEIYLQMFKTEKVATDINDAHMTRSSAYNHFHRGSFVALLKLIKSRVKTDWITMFMGLLDSISLDRTLVLGSNQIQELFIQLHLSGVYTEAWVVNSAKVAPADGPLRGWRDIPPAVSVTVVIPRNAIDRLYTDSKQARMAAPTLVGSLRASLGASNQWHSVFGDVQIIFGKATTAQDSESGGIIVKIEQDEFGWAGSSPLIASFTVSTASILEESHTALIGVNVLPTVQNSVVYGPILGPNMTVFETKMANTSTVLISRLKPGQTGHEIVCGGVQPFEDETPKADGEGPTKILAEVSTGGRITTLTGHITISSEKGKGLLRDKVLIELKQKDPFVIEIVFGKEKHACSLRYPVPVTKDGSKTRIARTSGYIEVIAPLAEPITSNILSDFVSPSVLTKNGLPVALNAPHLNLDCLPILDLNQKDDLKFLTTLTSLQFSTRVCIYHVHALIWASGGQTGMFAITNPDQGGIHMLVFISAIRLDGDTASVVLDAAVIPFTTRLIESGKLGEFLLILRTLECGSIKVDDAELLLWKKALPAMAERCRTWSHLPHCEYKQKKATIPVSLEHGGKVLCSCGNGKLPDNFVTVPEWETASQSAVRIAISPTYAVPFVEEVVDQAGFGDSKGSTLANVPRCRKCGKKEDEDGGVKLKRCMRCKKIKYCSAECQKADWKKHRMECEKAE